MFIEEVVEKIGRLKTRVAYTTSRSMTSLLFSMVLCPEKGLYAAVI